MPQATAAISRITGPKFPYRSPTLPARAPHCGGRSLISPSLRHRAAHAEAASDCSSSEVLPQDSKPLVVSDGGIYYVASALSNAVTVASHNTLEGLLKSFTGEGTRHGAILQQLNSTLSSFPAPETIFGDILAQLSSLESQPAILTTVTALVVAGFLFVARMSWASRLGNLGRFSPFTRSPPTKTEVSEEDFSYITTEDLRKHVREQQEQEIQQIKEQQEQQQQQQQQQKTKRQDEPVDLGPERDTDKVVVRSKRDAYNVHFPAYTIAKGDLSVRDLREAVARKVGHDAKRIKLIYKGKNMREDAATCRSYGLKDGSELMCTIGEPLSPSDSESTASESEAAVDGKVDGDSKRTKRTRNKNRKKREKRREQQRDSGRGSPHLQPPQSTSSTRSTSPAKPPATPAAPQTPLDRLKVLHDALMSFVPQCEAFKKNPPEDPAKRDFEHKRLSETILTQVLLKLDAVETEGDEDARARRKELVRETQAVLKEIDESMKR